MNLTAYPSTPRLVNRFKLGADPEFVLHHPEKGYVYAEACGLNTLQAFGCDMAGRQAEIRAYPSRFALEVVASVMDALRWMAFAHQDTLSSLNWLATAYNGKDGSGGHIHLGRRRPDRAVEVAILDSTTRLLLDAGVLDTKGFRNRQMRTHYGKESDVRLKAHGYEYRTLPTEMASPWLMYFVLVINKLFVYSGASQLTAPCLPPKQQLVHMLAQYADRDDDAAIAYKAIKNWGLPGEDVTDFRSRWGVKTPLVPESSSAFHKEIFFPSSIQPDETTCRELFQHLVGGSGVPIREAKATWQPFNMPAGFHKINVQQHTLGHLPDVGMNLISKVPMALSVQDSFSIYTGVPLHEREIREALRPLNGGYMRFDTWNSKTIEIGVPVKFKDSLKQCESLREVLAESGLFPVCKAAKWRETDWSTWENRGTQTRKPALGKLVAEVQSEVVTEPAPKPRPVNPEEEDF